MDQRETFQDSRQILSVVSSLQEQNHKASFLVDTNGLTRVEGNITSIEQQEDIDKTAITIDNVSRITLDQIIAVNGLFRSDYSEC